MLVTPRALKSGLHANKATIILCLQLRKKLCHLRFILDLSLSICSPHKAENLPLTMSDSYWHSINALVTEYHYVNSSTIYIVLAHSHLMQSSQGLGNRLDSLHTTEETKTLEDVVLCSASHSKPSGGLPALQLTKNTELLRVPQRHEWLLLYGDYAKLQLSFFCNVHELSAPVLC